MANSKYSDETKEQIVKKCREIGNTALVARRHNISKHTVYSWVKKAKETGSVRSLPKDEKKKMKEIENRLDKMSDENDKLKKIIAEKELELAILRELRDQVNPEFRLH